MSTTHRQLARNFMLRIATVVLACCLCAGTRADAAVQRICLVSMLVKQGWSPERKHRVAFVTGVELARIAPNLKIDIRQNYALVLPERGLPTVVMVDALVRTATKEFTADDFEKTFERFGQRDGVQVVGDGVGLKWQIKAKTRAGWVDPGMQTQTATDKSAPPA